MNISYILFHYSTRYFPWFIFVEQGQNQSASMSLLKNFFAFYVFRSIMNKTLGLYIALIKFCTPENIFIYVYT